MRNHKQAPFGLLVGLLLSLNNGAQAQAVQEPEIRELEPGVCVEGELAGGDKHHYRIALAAGQHASFQIVKQGVNVTLTLKGPAGESLFTANFEALEQGIETVLLIAKSDGPHMLIVEPDFKKSPRGRYQVKVDELREASEQDRRCGAAQLAFAEATQLFNKGTAESRQEAIKKLTESLPVWQWAGDWVWEARTLFWLGWIKLLSNKYAPAIHFLNQALALRHAARDIAGEAETLRTIGMVYTFTAENQKALEYFNKAMELQKGLGERWQSAFIFIELGKLYWRLGEQGKSDYYFAEGLRGLREVGDEENEAYVLGIERDRGELGKAQTYAEEAIKIIESLRAKLAGAELRASYLAVNQGYYEQYIDLLMRLHEQSPGSGHDALALEASERARARALLDSLVEARADIRQGGDPALLDRERSLQKQLSAKEDRRLRILSGKHTPEQAAAADREVEAALAEYQQAQAQIRATSPRYAALTQPQPLSLNEIQAQLDDETLLLVYSLGAKRSFLWAVTPATVKSYVLPAREKIENDVRGVEDRHGVYRLLQLSHQRKAKARAREATRQLSRLLLGPVAGQLTRKRLVIVADGALQYIPFAALTAPGSGRPLIAKHEIVNLPSVSALGQLRRDLAGRGPAPINNSAPELSGIVLSLYDKERCPQDGFLRAHELYNLKLGADLVVLSACETALGKDVRGEGLIGLSRGFMYAGAPRLVVSLWKVDEQATAELMTRFYRGMLRENLRPAAALRAAQASMARELRWRAPYYWAGFILQGEWR